MNIIVLFITVLGWSICSCKEDLDFDIDDEPAKPGGIFSSASQDGKKNAMQEALLKAMQKPAVKEQIGQVIPILRSMSPQQRLTLASLVSAQIMTPDYAARQSIDDVAKMFTGPGQAPKNVSEQLLLPISMDIAKMFKGIAGDAGRSWNFGAPKGETLHPITTQPLHAVPLPHRTNTTYSNIYRNRIPPKLQSLNDVNRRNGLDEFGLEGPNTENCDFLTSDICQEVSHYPEMEIMGSIQKHLSLMEPFLTEYGDTRREEPVHEPRIQRRQDDDNSLSAEQGYMCPSTVKYAKPKRARTTSGAWKYIVNTGDYTQTLRLEICTKNSGSCSYLNDQFRSVCQQVFNYHRLMCWDERRGLHMDVFKVPSCCSCHVQGYSNGYPPHQDIQYAEKRKEIVPIPQSSSGVKREIPRPHNNFRERPEPTFFETSTGDNAQYPQRAQMNFPEDTIVSESHKQQQRLPSRPFVFKEPSRQPSNQQQSFNQRPPFSNGDQTVESSQRLPGFGRPQGFQAAESQRVTDHLVPPGPPLPLDYERPRPTFDSRRRNETLHRAPEQNIMVEPSYNKRGTQKYEHTPQVSKNSIPSRTKRPVIKPVVEPAAAQTEVNRVQFKPSAADSPFGSKIRGQKPPKPSVFVTPSTQTTFDREDFEHAVRVTPKPSLKPHREESQHPQRPHKPPKRQQGIKGPPKKVNYNYHPIIDFFSSQGGSHFSAVPQSHRQAPPVQFNRRHHTEVSNDDEKVHQRQQPAAQERPYRPSPQQVDLYSQDQELTQQEERKEFSRPHNPQLAPGAHEWTPML